VLVVASVESGIDAGAPATVVVVVAPGPAVVQPLLLRGAFEPPSLLGAALEFGGTPIGSLFGRNARATTSPSDGL
jgi:hypothetical protein